MAEYLFDHHAHDQELCRLQMIEQLLDPTTIHHLERSGIDRGWHCLELGPGAGSIMAWMANVVGEDGRVVGIDKYTGHLTDMSAAPVQIIEADFLDVSLAHAFDLAHCRYVLIHNRDSHAALEKLCESLKPGGFLIAEEPDFTSARWLNRDAEPAVERVSKATCRMFAEMSLDPAYGLSLPQKIDAAGLQVIDTDARLHLARGGSLMARMMAASQRALAEKYVATGEASVADIERCIERANDEALWSVYYSTVSVTATKPDR